MYLKGQLLFGQLATHDAQARVHLDPGWKLLLLGAFLIVLSHAFKEGIHLKQENALTV